MHFSPKKTLKEKQNKFIRTEYMPNRKIKILFLLSRFLDGGIDTVLTEYLCRLSGNDRYEITLAIALQMNELEVFRSRIPGNIKIVHLVKDEWLTKWRRKKITQKIPGYIKLYDELLLNPIRRIITAKGIKQLAIQNDVIIDFDSHFHSFLKDIKKPIVAFYHFSFAAMTQRDPKQMKKLGHKLAHYDRIVTISNAMRQECEVLFPELINKLVVIYNAQDKKRLESFANEKVLDNRINTPFLIAVERLTEDQKDISTIIRSFKILRQRFQRTEKLYIIGKGNSEKALKQLAQEIGVANEVDFLGFQANPYPWINAAQLLVHSAKFEGLPTILIEGLMLNKLIVATDCPTGPKEILNDGKAGVLVPVGNAEVMADAINKLLTDKQLSATIKEGAKQHSYIFSFESTEKIFNNMIEQLLDTK